MEAKDQQTVILAVYKENCDQLRHHETQREKVASIVAQTAGILLALYGAIRMGQVPHWAVPIFLIFLGIWGFVAAWKHNERASMHQERIREFRRKMSELCEIDLDAINATARALHIKNFGPHVELSTRTHIIWKAFFVIIAIFGMLLLWFQ